MTVISIAATETETPTYPMMLRERATAGSSGIIGLALRRIPKCVRWVHSQTVDSLEERAAFLKHPIVDHSPKLRTEDLYLIRNILYSNSPFLTTKTLNSVVLTWTIIACYITTDQHQCL